MFLQRDFHARRDGENITGAADELADARGVPLISTLSPWEAWFFGRHGSQASGTRQGDRIARQASPAR
jgi:hypothetical protein